MDGVKVLFLHELESAPGSDKQKLVEKAIGKQNVKVPNLKTRQTILAFILLFFVAAIICVAGIIVSTLLSQWYVTLAVFLSSALILILGYWLGGRGVTQLMVRNAIKIAEKKFKEQRPNLIVGTSFGSVIALSMDIPKVPLLLLAPAQQQYARFMRVKPTWKISDYPYVMIVHGSNDKIVPLDDSIKLVETSEVGRCRLEVVDDNHALKSITSDDIKNWIEEVFTNGSAQALKMAADGDKNIDATLFPEGVQGSNKVSSGV